MTVETAPQSDVVPMTLSEHEAVIERGLASFVEVGNSLLAIKTDRLYRDAGFSTFEEYCQQRWNISRGYGYRLITAAATVEALAKGLPEVSPIGDIPTPSAESQVRPLTAVADNDKGVVWFAAVEAAGGQMPTAAQVQAAVDAHLDRAGGDADGSEPSEAAHREGLSPDEQGHLTQPLEPNLAVVDLNTGEVITTPTPELVPAEEQREIDRQAEIARRRKALAAIHSNWPSLKSLRTHPDRAEILRGLEEGDRQFVLDLERRVRWTD